MNEIELKVMVKGELLKLFPDAKWVDIDGPKHVAMAITNSHDLGDDMECLHKACREDGDTEFEAVANLLESVNQVRFFEQPDIIFFRCCSISKNIDFDLQETIYRAGARFALGYSKGELKLTQ